MLEPDSVALVLYRYAEPDVRRCPTLPIATAQVSHQKRASLGQYLIGVPIGFLHRIEDKVDEGYRHFLMEDVAHRIHKDASRLAPLERLLQPGRPNREVESVLKRVALDAAKALRKALGV